MSQRERRMLIILGSVVVVALAFFLLTRGGGAPEDEAAPTPTVSPSPIISPSPTPEVPGFSFFSGRDPFNPLVVEAEAADGDGDGTQPPSDDASPTPPVEPPTDGDDEGDGRTIGGHEVVLIDIFTQDGETMVQVRVDGTTHVVSVGETFADNFQLVSVQGGCANFLFGDQSFTLCEPGERK